MGAPVSTAFGRSTSALCEPVAQPGMASHSSNESTAGRSAGPGGRSRARLLIVLQHEYDLRPALLRPVRSDCDADPRGTAAGRDGTVASIRLCACERGDAQCNSPRRWPLDRRSCRSLAVRRCCSVQQRRVASTLTSPLSRLAARSATGTAGATVRPCRRRARRTAMSTNRTQRGAALQRPPASAATSV